MAVPYLIVNNAAKAIDFYREVFGASELVRLSAPDGKIAHAELMFAEGRIMPQTSTLIWGTRVRLP